MSAVDEALVRYGKRADLDATLAMANISMKPADFVASVGVIALVAGLVGLLFSAVRSLRSSSQPQVLPRGQIPRSTGKVGKRQRVTFADQLPDVLQLVTTALRSGYAMTQALGIGRRGGRGTGTK